MQINRTQSSNREGDVLRGLKEWEWVGWGGWAVGSAYNQDTLCMSYEVVKESMKYFNKSKLSKISQKICK